MIPKPFTLDLLLCILRNVAVERLSRSRQVRHSEQGPAHREDSQWTWTLFFCRVVSSRAEESKGKQNPERGMGASVEVG